VRIVWPPALLAMTNVRSMVMIVSLVAGRGKWAQAPADVAVGASWANAGKNSNSEVMGSD
jgi:hypothetical protein